MAALRMYESGRFDDAYREYSRLLGRRPDDVRLQFNAGASAYQARKYEDAVNHFSAAVAATAALGFSVAGGGAGTESRSEPRAAAAPAERGSGPAPSSSRDEFDDDIPF